MKTTMSNATRIRDGFSSSLAAALVPSDLPPINILIVDDEPRNLTVLETVLSDTGYRLVRALSADQALLALVNEEFALLILDVQMPDMTGFELAQIIKSRRKTAQIPIVFLTAHFNDDAHVLEGYGTGAVDYLHKPINGAALRSKVAVFAELHRKSQELALANRALAAEVVERVRAEDQLRQWNAVLDQRVVDRTQALDASNARLRMATDAVGLGFWTWNLGSDEWSWENDWPEVVFARPAVQWPHRASEFPGLLCEADREPFKQAVAQMIDSGTRFVFEGQVMRPDGSVRYVELDGRRTSHPHVPGQVLGTLRDVSERREAERELRESEARYRALFHSMDEGFCVLEAIFDDAGAPTDFMFVETNAAFHRHSGLAEVNGRLASAVVSQVDEDWLLAFGHVATTGEAFRRRDHVRGLGRVVDAYGFALEGVGAKRIAVLLRDVTESNRAEELLRERERFLSTVTDAASVGIAVVDSDYRYRFVNAAFVEMLEAGDEVQIGHPVGALNPQRWATTQSSIDRALQGERLSIEFTVTPPVGGSLRHVCAFLEPHVDEMNARTAAIVLVDITGVKSLEAELRAADRHKDEFLATLAHELRNPLAPVRNAVRILQIKAPAEARELVRASEIIERQVKVMARLIDDLMDVARINQGRIELQPKPTALTEIIALAVEASRPRIDGPGHTLVVTLPDEAIFVMADLTRLAQVFTNIITNAAKYTDKGGRIDLTARKLEAHVQVSVRDNGIGIEASNLTRVFDMFSQVEVALARSRGGLGIGLSLAKRLVEMQGGTICAQSEGLGHGSEFIITLPVVRHSDIAPSHVKTISSSACFGAVAPRTLVVDDNRDGAKTLVTLLSMYGIAAEVAFDGEEGLQKALALRPQLVLLDIGMPKMNGYELCRRIKAEPWGANTRVVAMTGWGDKDALKATTDAGFDRHLVKPVDDVLLLQVLHQLIPGATASHSPE
jgi:PAS domain S-box-containing protein